MREKKSQIIHAQENVVRDEFIQTRNYRLR